MRGFGWPCKNCHNLAIRALLEPVFCPIIFSSLCPISGYKLEDNDICARVLLGLSSKGYFLGDFWKISLGPPFALFQKMRVLGDLAIIAITCPFGHFWSRCLRQNISSLCTLSAFLLEYNLTCARVLLGLSSKGYFLGDFWKISFGPPFVLF